MLLGALGVWPSRDVADVFVRQASRFADSDVLGPFVLRATEPTDPQDEYFPVASIQRVAPQDVRRERHPVARQGRMIGHRLEDVVEPAGLLERFQKPLLLGSPGLFAHRIDAGPGHTWSLGTKSCTLGGRSSV